MPDAATSWLLRPEQLQVACEALGIGALPRSRFVEQHASLPDFAHTAGTRSLAIMRLADVRDDAVLSVEPNLARALVRLADEAPNAIAMLSRSRGEQCVVSFTDGIATALIEDGAGALIRVEPAVDAVARLEAQVGAALEAVDPGNRVIAAATVERGRWQALAAGGRVRRSDDPLVARAAAAAASSGDWEASYVLQTAAGRLEGEITGWVVDAAGLIVVEPDLSPRAGDAEVMAVRCDDAATAALRTLWEPLRHMAQGTSGEPQGSALHSAPAALRGDTLYA